MQPMAWSSTDREYRLSWGIRLRRWWAEVMADSRKFTLGLAWTSRAPMGVRDEQLAHVAARFGL